MKPKDKTNETQIIIKATSKGIVDRISQFALVSEGRIANRGFDSRNMLSYSASFKYPDVNIPSFLEYVSDMCAQQGLMPKITNMLSIQVCKNQNNTYSEKAVGNYYEIEII